MWIRNHSHRYVSETRRNKATTYIKQYLATLAQPPLCKNAFLRTNERTNERKSCITVACAAIGRPTLQLRRKLRQRDAQVVLEQVYPSSDRARDITNLNDHEVQSEAKGLKAIRLYPSCP